ADDAAVGRVAPRRHRAHHRARHGRGLLPVRPDHRAPLWRSACGRDARRRAWRSPRVRGLSRDRRRALTMLEIADVHAYYGDSHVLHGMSLHVAAGEAVALLGRNGAGKTTLIRSVVGFTPPRAGRRDRKSTRLNSSHGSISY